MRRWLILLPLLPLHPLAVGCAARRASHPLAGAPERSVATEVVRPAPPPVGQRPPSGLPAPPPPLSEPGTPAPAQPGPAPAPAPLPPSDPRAEEVIRKMLATYRAMKSYREEAVESVTQVRGQDRQTQTVSHTFIYQAPNRFFYDIRSGRQQMQALACDGKTAQTVNQRAAVGMRAKAPPRIEGIGMLLMQLDFSTTMDPFAFLVGEDPLARGRAELATATLNGKPVYEVRFTGRGSGTTTFFIGQRDSLLYRVRAHTAVENVEFIVEETHSEMRVNPKLPPQAFSLRIPPGMRIIDLPENPPSPGIAAPNGAR